MAVALVDHTHNAANDASHLVRTLRTFRRLCAVLAGIVVVFSIALSALTFAATDKGLGPELFGRHFLVVRSGSMEPSLRTGALAVTQPISPEDVSSIPVGTVIAYRSLANPEMLIMHRVVARTSNVQGDVQYVTKGDANIVEDSLLLDSSRVVGTLSSSVAHAGYVVTALQRGQLLRLVLLAFVLVSTAVVLSNWATRSESLIKTEETT